MSEIVKELREHAAHCRACGEETTANLLLHAADWIDVCENTIRAQKGHILDLEAEIARGYKIKKIIKKKGIHAPA